MSNNKLTYKGYHGSVEVDIDRGVCRGKIEMIPDLVTYEAESIKDIKAQFEAAVDDYLEMCEELGREPKKPYSGQFNVRIEPQMHFDAKVRALKDEMTLNELVSKALGCYIYGTEQVTNHKTYVVVSSATHGENIVSSTITGNEVFGVTAYANTQH